MKGEPVSVVSGLHHDSRSMLLLLLLLPLPLQLTSVSSRKFIGHTETTIA